MLQLVRELRMRYPSRLVVFDLPPLLSTDDALAFAPYVDAMLLVVEEGKTPRDELLNAVRLMESANENLIGTVLNKSRSVQPTASYGY
jgi:Mrp family chromosome partitioning ATPase